MRKPLIVVLVVALAAAVVAGALWWSRSQPAAGDGTLLLQGNVDVRQVALAFDLSGRVTRVDADEGQAVKAGALLATLDTRTLELQAAHLRAQIDVQRQNLLRLRRGARPQELEQAQSRLAAAEADAGRARREAARLQKVAAETDARGVSAMDLDRAATAVQTARARADEQRAALALLQQGARAEDLDAARSQLDAAQAQLALLQHQIGQGQLLAPADAVVRSRLLEPGDMASPQRPVLALALLQPKWVRVYVGEPDLGRLQPGMAASVVTDSQPGESIAGRVGYIASVAEFTPKSVQTEELRTSLVYEVRVLVSDEANRLRLGQPVSVRLALDATR